MVGSHKLYEGVTGDCRYHHAYFDGSATHRIRGFRGDSPLIEIGIYTGKGGYHAGSVQIGGVTEADLKIGEDGHFELVLSPDRHDGNWVETGPDARYVMIREYAADWGGLAPGRFEIVREGASEARAPVDLDRVIAGLEGTRDWMWNAPPRWAEISDFWLPLAPNLFVPELPENDVIDIGVPRRHSYGRNRETIRFGNQPASIGCRNRSARIGGIDREPDSCTSISTGYSRLPSK